MIYNRNATARTSTTQQSAPLELHFTSLQCPQTCVNYNAKTTFRTFGRPFCFTLVCSEAVPAGWSKFGGFCTKCFTLASRNLHGLSLRKLENLLRGGWGGRPSQKSYVWSPSAQTSTIPNRNTTIETSGVSNSRSPIFAIWNTIINQHLWATFCSISRCSNLCNLHCKLTDWDSVVANPNLVAISTKFKNVGTSFTFDFTETFT